jgi:hypothetical protein
MAGFHVDLHGLTDAYNLLVRAHGDATDTLAYTVKHCELDFDEEGLIFYLAGPHAEAYKSVTTALKQLGELSRGAGIQINLAQLAYARVDASAAARLDGTYPGASDPITLRGTLASNRGDLDRTHAPFSDVTEPTSHLIPPSYATEIQTYQLNPLTDLLSPTAWIRQVCVKLFSYDPFQGWAKLVSGDWDAYYHCAATWGHIGGAAQDIGRNLISGAQDVTTVWTGNAAEAEQEFQISLGSAAMKIQPACYEYARLYREAAEAAKQLFTTVTGLLGQLIDILIIINAAAAVGTATIETGVGPVVGYGVAAYYAWQAYELYKEISSFYQIAEMTVKGIAGSVAGVQAGMDLAKLPTVKPYHHPSNS